MSPNLRIWIESNINTSCCSELILWAFFQQKLVTDLNGTVVLRRMQENQIKKQAHRWPLHASQPQKTTLVLKAQHWTVGAFSRFSLFFGHVFNESSKSFSWEPQISSCTLWNLILAYSEIEFIYLFNINVFCPQSWITISLGVERHRRAAKDKKCWSNRWQNFVTPPLVCLYFHCIAAFEINPEYDCFAE